MLEDLNWEQGSENMGGLVGDLYWIPVTHLDLTTPPTLDADGVTISSDLAVKDALTQGFAKIYHTKGTGKIDSSMVGERDGKSYEQMCEFFFPGEEKKVEAFKKDFKNTPGVLIGKDADGNLRVMGLSIMNGAVTADLPAYLESASSTTGQASADRRGTTFQFKAESGHAALFYEGTIPLLPAA